MPAMNLRLISPELIVDIGELAELRGKYVLLQFWFAGCLPCQLDFPSVKLAHELYKEKGLVVVGIHNNHQFVGAPAGRAHLQN